MNKVFSVCLAPLKWVWGLFSIDLTTPPPPPPSPALAEQFPVTASFADPRDREKLEEMRFWCLTRFGPAYGETHEDFHAQWGYVAPDFVFADESAAILFKMRWSSLANPITIRKTPHPRPA